MLFFPACSGLALLLIAGDAVAAPLNSSIPLSTKITDTLAATALENVYDYVGSHGFPKGNCTKDNIVVRREWYVSTMLSAALTVNDHTMANAIDQARFLCRRKEILHQRGPVPLSYPWQDKCSAGTRSEESIRRFCGVPH